MPSKLLAKAFVSSHSKPKAGFCVPINPVLGPTWKLPSQPCAVSHVRPISHTNERKSKLFISFLTLWADYKFLNQRQGLICQLIRRGVRFENHQANGAQEYTNESEAKLFISSRAVLGGTEFFKLKAGSCVSTNLEWGSVGKLPSQWCSGSQSHKSPVKSQIPSSESQISQWGEITREWKFTKMTTTQYLYNLHIEHDPSNWT